MASSGAELKNRTILSCFSALTQLFVISLPHLSLLTPPLTLLPPLSAAALPLSLLPSLIFCQLSPSYLTCSLIAPVYFLPPCFLSLPLLWHVSPFLLQLKDHITALAVPVFAGFIAPFLDNSPVLTGWSYYPLYEMSMLRALYEILVSVDKMMELASTVIPQPYNGISWEIHNAMDYW